MTGPTIVARGVNDADLAAELKDRAAAALKPLCEIMAEANRAGMAVQFDQIAMDAFGRFHAINLRVVKVFA